MLPQYFSLIFCHARHQLCDRMKEVKERPHHDGSCVGGHWTNITGCSHYRKTASNMILLGSVVVWRVLMQRCTQGANVSIDPLFTSTADEVER